MKNTTNAKTENDDIKIIGKKFVFVINNDENNEKTNTNVIEFIHIGTAYDSITGGTVEMIYLKFENRLLNRIVYLDNTILERGTILLPIDDRIEYVPFGFKYVNGTRKRTTKKSTPKTSTANTKTDTKKTENKTPTKTPKTKKTTDKKVVTE